MRETAAQVTAQLADKPVLILCGQFDPVRLVGGISRYQRLFRNSAVSIVPRERHFPILAEGHQVATLLTRWMHGIGWPAQARAR